MTSEAETFYATNYDVLENWVLRPGQKITLGDKGGERICRFCDKRAPDVTFNMVAHALPESLGNKSLESAYECDTCNGIFGRGIEDHLGNWSKPMRTFARIRGKKGVPTLKKGGPDRGWRIEYDAATGLKVTAYEDEPIFEVDEVEKKVRFKLKRDPYIPVAVLKAFMKIGLTLLPGDEIGKFVELKTWVMEEDHTRVFAVKCPVIYQFQPGPMPNDRISLTILRRKAHVTGLPYCYLVLCYGNESFQVQLPSDELDRAVNGTTFSLHPYPHPWSSSAVKSGAARRGTRDFTGREIVRGEIVPLVMSYDRGERVPVAPEAP